MELNTRFDFGKWLIEEFVDAEGKMVARFLTRPTPFIGGGDDPPAQTNPADPQGFFDVTAVWTTSHVLWLAGAVATVSIGIAGGKMLWNHNRGYHQSLREVFGGLISMVLSTLLVIYAAKVMIWVGDRYSHWILKEESGLFRKDEQDWECQTKFLHDSNVEGLLIIIAIFMVMALGIQVILMSFRGAVLILLAATIVVPAAAATTETGRKWLNKYLCWIMAFIWMKPAAATVFAVAGRLYDPDPGEYGGCPEFDTVEEQLAGLVLMGAACFVLPALLRILTPGNVSMAAPFASAGAWFSNEGVAAFRNRFAWTGSRGGSAGGGGSGGGGGGGGGGGPAGGLLRRGVRRTAGIGAGVGSLAGMAAFNVHTWQDATSELREEFGSDGSDGPIGGGR